MWIIKRSKLVFMCTGENCENTEHFIIENKELHLCHIIHFICTICKSEYNINEVVEWED